MTNYRQGPGPYGGAVPPAGTLLVLQEEFQYAGQPGAGAPGPGTSPLPARWLPWFASAFVTDPAERWIDGNEQKLTQYGPASTPGDPAYGWQGAVMRFPTIELEQLDPDFFVAFLSVFAGIGFGPQNVNSPWGTNQEILAALVLSGADLSVTPDSAFSSFGMRARVNPATGEIEQRVQGADWLNPVSFPFSSNDLPALGLTGILLRIDMLIERVTIDPGPPPVFDTETEYLASFSTDQGRSWWPLRQGELKGGLAEVPLSIGFGISTLTDTISLPNVTPNNPTGGFDFLRIYRRPFDEASLFLNPDGGRNWP